jgi:uncharacterized protein YchJ
MLGVMHRSRLAAQRFCVGSRVLFHAAVFDKGKDRSFVELSTFARDDAGWRYVAGETTPAPGAAPVDWTIERWVPRA